jgi:hypothetical protein
MLKSRFAILVLALSGSAAIAQDIKPLPGAAPAPAPSASPAPSTTPAPAAKPAVDPFASIPPARPADVRSVESIVAALYDVISGDAGVKRDWNRFRSLFYPGARMIPTRVDAKTKGGVALIATPEIYIQNNQQFLEGEGFHERELHRHVDRFGSMAQVFSVYEARNKLSDEKPLVRGINSIQLLNDGKRWWVMTIAWHPESEGNPLPAEYLKKVER